MGESGVVLGGSNTEEARPRRGGAREAGLIR